MVASQRVDEARELARSEGWRKVQSVVAGGPRRRDSVRIGLEALNPALEWAIIHDGARPLTTPQMIAAGLAAAQQGRRCRRRRASERDDQARRTMM